MATTNINQSGVNQANSANSQYINKVKILPDGSLEITKTSLLPKNLAAPLPEQKLTNSSVNQISGQSSSSVTSVEKMPDSTTLNSQGINVGVNPVGPPSVTE